MREVMLASMSAECRRLVDGRPLDWLGRSLEHIRSQLRHTLRPELGHDKLQLHPDFIEHRIDTFRPGRCQRPQKRSAEKHRSRSERERNSDVLSCAKPAVRVEFNAVT